MTRRERAEALWESLAGDLCICQRPDVPHWCEGCQNRISQIVDAFNAERAPALGERWDLPQRGNEAKSPMARGRIKGTKVGKAERRLCVLCGRSCAVGATGGVRAHKCPHRVYDCGQCAICKSIREAGSVNWTTEKLRG